MLISYLPRPLKLEPLIAQDNDPIRSQHISHKVWMDNIKKSKNPNRRLLTDNKLKEQCQFLVKITRCGYRDKIPNNIRFFIQSMFDVVLHQSLRITSESICIMILPQRSALAY